MTIRFIDTDKALRNIICLSKDLNEILREEVLKQSLMRSDIHTIEKKRKGMWLSILKVDEVFALGEFTLYH